MALELFGYSVPLLLVVAGTILVLLEAASPGANFIVIGTALLVAGLVGLTLGTTLGALTPFVLAIIVLLVSAISYYLYGKVDMHGPSAGRTSDSASLRGQTGRVTTRVTPNEGEVKLDAGGFNPYYQARSMDGELAEGEEVMVIDPGGGNVVTVESISNVEDDIDRELARERAKRERERERADDSEDATDSEPA